MLTVADYELIRRKHFVDGQSARAIAKELGHSRKAVAKALAHAVPPGYRQRKPRAKPAIDGYRAIIDGWLDADVTRPRKQRHTARRVFERLRDEHGFAGSECTVRRYVASRKSRPTEVFVPLFFGPGDEAQVDWGEAVVIMNGQERKVHLFCMRLCHSRHTFVRAYERANSRHYQALTEAAPDFIAQLELEQLATLRPMDREELIGSTKNRFLNFLRNPIVELGLSKPDGHVDLTRAIRERSIIIVNLDRGGVLRDEDVEIFANLWLHEVLYAVYNTPRGERVPHFLMIDELPTFRSSFDVITSALAQVRKFLCRFVVAFQGTQLFDDRERDRLLNALVGAYRPNRGARYRPPRAASR